MGAMIIGKARVGFVVVASRFESGGERANDFTLRAKSMLEGAGYEVCMAGKTVWDAADALSEASKFAEKDLDFLLVLHASWVLDSLQYLFINTLRVPMLMWAVPYTETFSLGCVQHFGSILSQQGIPYDFVYGLPEDKDLQNELEVFASAAKAYKTVSNSKIALLGPRQTWRVANSQDMTSEEWEFSDVFGTTIVHIEMTELLELIKEQKDTDAAKVLEDKRKAGLGRSIAEESRLIYEAKVYLGMKELFRKYGLTALAAECYPDFGGMANLPSSWFADEGIIVDTEGDISHTAIMVALNEISAGATALAEIGNIDKANDALLLAHEGSSAHSLAADLDKVQLSPLGDNGVFVGLPLKPMKKATAINLCGKAGNYTMTVVKGSVLEVSKEEWVEGGSKLVAKFKPQDCGAMKAYKKMLEAGADHHLLVREGDLSKKLKAFCSLAGIDMVLI